MMRKSACVLDLEGERYPQYGPKNLAGSCGSNQPCSLHIVFWQIGRRAQPVKAMNYDALIIGGGPAGATAALLLARAGWSVAVVEMKEFPRGKVCGEFISATSQPLLRELGVDEAFRNRAGPEVRRVGLFAQDTVLAAAMPRLSSFLGQWGRALGREH